MRFFLNFLRDTRASVHIEYGVIAAVISIAVVSGATYIGTRTQARFDAVASAFAPAPAALPQ